MQTDTQSLWQVREYDPARDAEMVESWAKAHGTHFVNAALSPISIIACLDGKPKAVAWLYLCVGAPVAYIDRIFTAAKQTVREASDAVGHCVEALKVVAQAHGVAVIYSFVPPAIGAYGKKRLGFRLGHRNLTQVALFTS